jgi:propionate catabolism operon transcriptional regulator
VLHIELPPLSARRSDVLEIARHLLTGIVAEYRLPGAIMPDVLAMLAPLFEHYAWPGNVRELANLLTRAAVHVDELKRGSHEDLLAVFPELRAVNAPLAGTSQTPAAVPLTPGDVRRALEACGGNRGAAAKRLGISRTTLWRLAKETAAS